MDFEKAYDSVKREVLSSILVKFGLHIKQANQNGLKLNI
jgi:hypothetical protein